MKNIFSKKSFAFMMATAMSLVLTACQETTQKAPSEAQEQEASVPKTVTDGANPQDLEPYTITWAYIGDGYTDTDKVEGKINEILQPKFNCTVDIMPLSWGEFTQKLNLMLSGDEALDIVPVIYENAPTYLNNGQVIDMKELMEKYGTNMKEVIGEENLFVCNVNGKVYGAPVCREYVTNLGVMMRKDLLQEAGFTVEDIKSLDDLDAVYAKVKEKNPDMVMLAGRKGSTPGNNAIFCDSLSDNFGVIMPDDTTGTVVNYFETEEFMNIANTMYDYANKGYISKDCATMNDTRQAQIKAGTAFSYLTPIKPGTDLQDSLDTGHEMTYAMLTKDFRSTSAMAWIGWGIGKNCKYPERTVEVLDYFYNNAELMNLYNWGIEGEHYTFTDKEKGIITYPEGVTAENKKYGLNIGYELPNQYISYVWEGNDPAIWDEYKEFNKAEPLISTGFIYDNASVATEVSALANVRDQYLDAIGSGAVDPAVAVPELNEALKRAGIEKVIQVKQDQLNTFINNNKE